MHNTDGEDHNSEPLDAVEGAVKMGIPVVTIGFGSEEGSPITLTDPETGAKTKLKDRDDTVVISRLDGELLREIALQTDGAFIPAGVASLDLEGIVQSHITPIVIASSIRQVQRRSATVDGLLWHCCWWRGSVGFLAIDDRMGYRRNKWRVQYDLVVVSLFESISDAKNHL